LKHNLNSRAISSLKETGATLNPDAGGKPPRADRPVAPIFIRNSCDWKPGLLPFLLRTQTTSVSGVLRDILSDPWQTLFRRWNWKSAVFSSSTRALIFFFANLSAGLQAASGAMMAEFVYRAVFAGFYGSLTQAFRRAEPAWKANLAAMVLLPAISHGLELLVHAVRGTPNLKTSLLSSMAFTALSTLYNLYAMRRGALVVGEDAGTVLEDLRRTPALIAGFVAAGPKWLWGQFKATRELCAAPLEEEPRTSELLLTPNVSDQR
jgi:hypothetical protein